MRATTVAAVLSAAWMTTGCIGPNCQSTCGKLFGETPDFCELRVPGRELQESRQDCIAECEHALTVPGEVGSYNPFELQSGSEPVLENEKQAALWMDCVEQHSCEDIGEGFCAPIGF